MEGYIKSEAAEWKLILKAHMVSVKPVTKWYEASDIEEVI